MLVCDHIALVVRELEPVLDRLAALGVGADRIEEFPSEGTREVYLGADAQPGRVLLLQPLGSGGPYARALAKRGQGLHHVAFHTTNAHAFIRERPGWLLHPQSLESFESNKTLWLARPGIGTLVEAQEGETSYVGTPLVERLELPVAGPVQAGLVAGLSRATVLAPGAGVVRVAGEVVEIASLVD